MHTPLSKFLITLLPAMLFCHAGNTDNLTIYQSLGKFGEARYTQTPPIGTAFEPMTIFLPKQANQHANQAFCQNLNKQLATLSSGGQIHEIDAQGNQKLLNATQIEQAKHQIRQTLSAQCQSQ